MKRGLTSLLLLLPGLLLGQPLVTAQVEQQPGSQVIGLAGTPSDSAILGLSGMSYWVAGQETDSQNLTQLGSSDAGAAQFGSTSGSDSNDPTSLPWYATSNYDVTVDGVNYKYLSDNLVTNGTFDTDTWWGKDAGWSITGGQAVAGGGSNYQIYSPTSSLLTVGSTYRVTFDILSITGSVKIVAGSTNSSNINTTGSKEVIITAAVDGRLRIQANTSATATIDNVVVREVTANLGDHVYLPGTTGNYLSHPDSAAVSVTGDITIQVECALDDLTSVLGTFLGKYSGAGARSYLFCLDGSGGGKPRLYWSTDGTASASATCSVVTGFSNGQKGFFRVTVDVDNGASDADIKFWASSDGETFSQLGTTQNAGSTISLYDSVQQVEIGTYGDGTSGLNTGSFYSAHIWNSDIGDTATSSAGTPVMHWEASSMTQSGGADQESGGTWTINRSASGLKSTLVTRPVIVFNSAASTYLEVADHDDLDMGAADDFTVWVYGRQHSTPSVSMSFLTKKQALGTAAGEGYSLQDNAGFGARFVIGDSSGAIVVTNPITHNSTSALFAGIRDTVADAIEHYFNGAASGSPVTDTTTGTLSNSYDLKIGTDNGGGEYPDLELFAAGVLKGTSLSSDQLTSLKSELDTILSGRTGE